MNKKPITVIFLAKNSYWPKGLDDDWGLIRESWYEFKGFVGAHLPGMCLIVGDKAIGGVSAHLSKDPVSKRKALDYLKAQGYEVEISMESPY